MKKLSILSILIFQFVIVQAQVNWQSWKEDYKIQVNAGLQTWGTYTLGQKLVENTSVTDLDNRLNFQTRRIRLGVKGQPHERLKFNITLASDFIGRDILSAAQGGTNNGALPDVRLWHAFIQYRLISDIYVTVGKQAVQFSRENITAASASNSFEKAWSQNYIRRHLVGTGPGRTMGVNIGTLKDINDKLSYSVDLGVYTPKSIDGNNSSQGVKSSPLLASRLALYIGDKESEKYSTGHKVNYFGKRNGVTLAFSSAYSGGNDFLESNSAHAVDLLCNMADLNVSGEWAVLRRTVDGLDQSASANVSFIRAGYNINVAEGKVLEPVVMLMQFNGAMEGAELESAIAARSTYGKDQMIEIGFNYYWSPKVKVYAFLNLNEGEAGDDYYANNNYFQNVSGGAFINRGNMIGMGFSAAF